ncbi:MAG: prolyl aminopeptidase [Deltaproteobacteria bacterium]|nr:MAG: prolyl aminopeptidase [Deltaproteobacteria bacterium]
MRIAEPPYRPLYPAISPFDTGMLDVGDGHRIYYEQSGNPDGKPVVFLHGGPGGGTEPKHRRYFDPQRYRIVLFDQRGCGRSLPHAELAHNTTWDLVDDIDRLRTHLGIDRWQVFGGSWGSTLAVAYGSRHPDRVTEFVLRGIFLFLPDEVDWFYRSGTALIFPEAYEAFLAHLPPDERDDPIANYYRRLTADDPEVRRRAAEAWSTWECSVATLRPDPNLVAYCRDPSFSLAFSRIECHYFVNDGFLQRPTELLDAVERIRHLPCTIVHGRYDVICPVRNAHRLHRAWPDSDLVIVPDAGHSASEPGIVSELVAATDAYANG